MKAVVCDKCGKVVLCESEMEIVPDGIFRLSDGRLGGVSLELCTECVAELMSSVRERVEEL